MCKFHKILKESSRKPNKIWVDKGTEFSNNFFKKWLKDNEIEVYSINNERKFVVAFSNLLEHLRLKSINTYHRTVKIKPVYVKDNTYIDFKKEVNAKDPRFKVGDRVRISR